MKKEAEEEEKEGGRREGGEGRETMGGGKGIWISVIF